MGMRVTAGLAEVGAGVCCYGFNGKEIDNDQEWGQGTTAYDYGFRIYNPGIARFLSVDPLSPDYPWYTPYQFAGNKPIWATDVDGLEEVIYQYTIDRGSVTLLNVVDNRDVQTTFDVTPTGMMYNAQTKMIDKRTGKPFEPGELGMVQYQYFDNSGNPLNTRRDYTGKFVEGQNELMPYGNDNLFGSIYIGPNNPTVEVLDDNGEVQIIDDYRREPQDEVDAAALQHDKNYGLVGAQGAQGALFDRDAIAADDVLLKNAIKSFLKGMAFMKDDVTGKMMTNETMSRASAVMSLFATIRGTVKGGGYPDLEPDEQPRNTGDLSNQAPASSDR